MDSIRILRLDAGLFNTTPAGCIPMGESVDAGGIQRIWGDFNCDGEANALDSLMVLRFDAGLDVDLPANCPDLGASA